MYRMVIRSAPFDIENGPSGRLLLMSKMRIGIVMLPALFAAAAAVGESADIIKQEPEMRIEIAPSCAQGLGFPAYEKFRDKPTRGPRRR